MPWGPSHVKSIFPSPAQKKNEQMSLMAPFHLGCVSVNQGRSVNFGLSQSDAELFEHFRTISKHKCHINDSNRSELRQYSVKMGRCRSVCGNSCVDGAMMRVRVAMHWDAHRTDIRRCGLVCDAVASMLRHGGSQRVTEGQTC